jgi:hypothetical protein
VDVVTKKMILNNLLVIEPLQRFGQVYFGERVLALGTPVWPVNNQKIRGILCEASV